MPKRRFQLAEPIDGYLIAAALMLEGAVTSLLTLNFDLAIVAALTQLGSRGRVVVVNGPGAIADIGQVNVVYLHRDAHAPADEWILRSASLDNEWRSEWQEAMATKILTAPVVVFAGLGTAAVVLVETISRIRAMLGDAVKVYQVDVDSPDKSPFFAALKIPETAYVRSGWCAFMGALGQRLLDEHRAALEEACRKLAAQEGFSTKSILEVVDRLLHLGLLGTGKFRARCMLDSGSYLPHETSSVELLADLLLGVSFIENEGGAESVFGDDGVVEFFAANRLLAIVILASGQGTRRWLSLEAQLSAYPTPRRPRVRAPRVALVAGVPGGRPPDVAAPRSVVGEDDGDRITSPPGNVVMVSVDEIRSDPQRLVEIFS
jgi:hypothetical protein